MDQPWLTVIILAYNTRDLVLQCLDRFYAALTASSAQIIVVDNASSDGTYEAVQNTYPHVEVIRSTTNTGYAGGNNLGLRQATGKVVVLLNSDVLVSAETLSALARALPVNMSAGALSPGLLTAENKAQAFAYGDDPTLGYLLKRGFRALLKLGPLHHWDIDHPIDVDWASGACLMVRQEVIEQVGLLDERFFLYFEDVDWCMRIRKAGWHVVYDPRHKVVHLGGASQPQRGRANHIYYESMLTLYRKHFGPVATLMLKLLLPFYVRLIQ